MRNATGFGIIFTCFIIFIMTLVAIMNELHHTERFTEVLDSKIPIHKIVLQQNSFMLDNNNNVISEITGEEKRIYLPDKQIPAIIKNIFVAVEDKDFYHHNGFNISSIARAALINMKANSIEQGGSTITQQLARNLFLNDEKSYNRKLSELLYSYQLESKLSKQKILELYINEIYFQHGIYGIEEASKYYFNLPSKSLSLAQSAFLCSIPNNPSFYDPISNYQNTKKRQTWILKKLLEQKLITEAQFTSALHEKIVLHLHSRKDDYPAYTTYILDELKNLISVKEGYTTKIEKAAPSEKEKYRQQLNKRYQQILHSGISIHTALDPNIQKTALKAIATYLPDPGVQAVAVVIDHHNHQIVAMTGGKNYQKYGFQRAYQAYRQPGSAIKPLLVYAPFINETGATPQTIVNAEAVCANGYCPENYGKQVYGNVTLEAALKYSYNTAAVRLLEQVGVQKAFHYLHLFHFSKITQEDYTLAGALGGFSYGMTPLELTSAYTTFGNDGKYSDSHGIIDVTDRSGKVLYKWSDNTKTVWSKRTNSIMRSLLTSVVEDGTARRAYFNSTYIGGKTGTTNDFKDLWFIGLTNHYTTGVWVGKDYPANIEYIDRSTPQLAIWKMIME